MRSVLIFLLLIALVVCPFPDFDKDQRKKKRKEFKKQITKCILQSNSISKDLRKEIEENEDEDDLKKILHLYVSKLDENDREVIRKCRREYFF